MTIKTRSDGVRLTSDDMDANFTELDTTKLATGSGADLNKLVVWETSSRIGGTEKTLAQIKNVDNHVGGLTNSIFLQTEKATLDDTPKVLAGHIYTGGPTWRFNPDNLSAVKNSTGTVTITHNIGHTNYWVMASPIKGDANSFYTVVSTSKLTTSCNFIVKQANGTTVDTDLSFSIFYF